MADVKYSFFIGNTGDAVVSIPVGEDVWSDTSAQALADDPLSPFSITDNENGQKDLTVEVDENVTVGNGTFTTVGTSDNYIYTPKPWEVVGPQYKPPKRCPSCPPL